MCVCGDRAPVIFARDGDNQRDAGVCDDDDVACEFLCEVLMRNCKTKTEKVSAWLEKKKNRHEKKSPPPR